MAPERVFGAGEAASTTYDGLAQDELGLGALAPSAGRTDAARGLRRRTPFYTMQALIQVQRGNGARGVREYVRGRPLAQRADDMDIPIGLPARARRGGKAEFSGLAQRPATFTPLRSAGRRRLHLVPGCARVGDVG
jgi:hypothetical protein